jgi:hypothetical protein
MTLRNASVVCVTYSVLASNLDIAPEPRLDRSSRVSLSQCNIDASHSNGHSRHVEFINRVVIGCIEKHRVMLGREFYNIVNEKSLNNMIESW